jgi:fatty-acyl-CoA synthase
MNMLSYSRGPEAPLLECTIYEALAATVARAPQAEALVSCQQGLRYTFAGFMTAVESVSAGLTGLGLEPGDRFGIWATNCAEWVMLQFAAARAGLVLINVNPAYRSHELAYILKKSAMKALFLPRCDSRSDYAAILAEARAGFASGESDGESLSLQHAVCLHTEEWQTFLDNGVARLPAVVHNTDVANIQYTSGTTGSPKGVLLTHRNLVNNAAYVADGMRYSEDDRICVPVPLYHCFGAVCGALIMAVRGQALILPAPTFDARSTMAAIQNERATAVYGVPTMFIAQLHHPDFSTFDFSSLRAGIMAGAPCPIEVMRRVQDEMHCPGMTVVYGQTESSPVITGSASDDEMAIRVTTVGRAYPNTEVKIAGPEGEPVPVGQQGELCTRGYLVMLGYDGEPEATARAVDGEGWLHTGDLAVMREDGNFHITGRSKDLIIRGGENIYPREVEEFLHTHPKIADVQVIGLPHMEYGECVAAWIRLKPGESATAADIQNYCRGKIAHFKIPQHIRFTDSFPMTVTGKIQKFRMRQIEIEELGLAAAAAVKTA